MQHENGIPIDSKRALAALVASNVLGMLTLFMIPLVIGATADGFEKDDGIVGIVSSFELASMAAASTALAARYKRLDPRWWTGCGFLVYLGATLLTAWSMFTGQWFIFILSRILVGLGEGTLYGISSGLAAQTKRPVNTWAWITGFHVAVSVVGYAAMPTAIEAIGPVGGFAVLLGIGVFALPFLFFTPVGFRAQEDSPGKSPVLFGRLGVRLLLCVASMNLGLNMLFPYIERIGVSIGFTGFEIASVLSWGAIAAIAGPIAASFLSSRTGCTAPIGLGAISQVGASMTLVYITSFAIWAIASVLSSIALMYFLPLIYGLVAFHDRSGQLSVAAASVTAWASAAGPLLAGAALAAGAHYPLVAWMSAGCFVAMFGLAYGPARTWDAAPTDSLA